MAFSGRGLLRAAANLMGAGYRGAERGRQTARQERLDDEKLRREAEREALEKALLEARTENLRRPEAPPLITYETGERGLDVPGARPHIPERAEPRIPNVTSPSGERIPDVPGAQVAVPGSTTGGAAMTKAISDNRTKAKVIGDALTELRRRPEGVGLKGLIPEIILQRDIPLLGDPGGVPLRADIADIGSMVIHDRSGSAVSAKEMPRLEPFIPKDTDTSETIRWKLERFLAIIEEETQFLEDNIRKGAVARPEGVDVPAVSTSPASRTSSGLPLPAFFRPPTR